MTFRERLEVAPIIMVWIFIVLPIALAVGGAAIFFYLMISAGLCFRFAYSRRR